MPQIKKNTKLKTLITKKTCEVIEFIGSGGQGEVYKAKYGKEEVALKWYFKHTATKEQESILHTLIKEGSPNEHFLWPMDIVVSDNGFGYIMGLRPSNYKVMVSIMNRSVEPSFHSLLNSAILLSDSFFRLHAKGLCYRDISYNNIFINPDNGDILICDNDNVTYNNISCKTILGTPKFMAPEVVTRKSLPNQYSDLYSLAILLFYLLFISHPLEGELEYNIKCLDVPAMNKLYGENPVFIFDPQNKSNRPVKGVHDNALIYWNLYPSYIKDAFTKAFTEGIKDPHNGRVRETIWRQLLLSLKNSILYCKCGAENFYDKSIREGNGHKCWSCGQKLIAPPMLVIGNSNIMLNYDSKVYPCQIDSEAPYEFKEPIARMVQNPINPSVWGLNNMSKETIYATTTDGTVNKIPPGKSQTILNNLTINFGKATGTIVV